MIQPNDFFWNSFRVAFFHRIDDENTECELVIERYGMVIELI
jgi:hypothetical protein